MGRSAKNSSRKKKIQKVQRQEGPERSPVGKLNLMHVLNTFEDILNFRMEYSVSQNRLWYNLLSMVWGGRDSVNH